MKMVKCSQLVDIEESIKVYHYNTVIFYLDKVSNDINVYWDYSRTSDKMIRRCLEEYNNPKYKVINNHQNIKWSASI